MKRIATIALLLCSMVAVAQGTEGQWRKTTIYGDDLKGIADQTTYTYYVEGIGKMVVTDWASCYFTIVADHPLAFDRVPYSERNSGIELLVGIYNHRGHLTERIRLWMSSVNRSNYRIDPHTAWLGIPIRQTKKIRHIFDVLRADDGRYVRMICPLENRAELDINVRQYFSNHE